MPLKQYKVSGFDAPNFPSLRIACHDIGVFAALAFCNPSDSRFCNRSFVLVGEVPYSCSFVWKLSYPEIRN